MEELRSGYFKHKKVHFSQVSNVAITDENLSLKAKGLYTLIQHYITIPNFTLYKSFLMDKTKEGERAFNSAWTELKERGYLVQYKTQSEKGFLYIYDLFDEPAIPTPTFCTSGEIKPTLCKTEQRSDINNTNKFNTLKNNTDNNNNVVVKKDDAVIKEQFLTKVSGYLNDVVNLGVLSLEEGILLIDKITYLISTLPSQDIRIINASDPKMAKEILSTALNIYGFFRNKSDDYKYIENKEAYLIGAIKNIAKRAVQ